MEFQYETCCVHSTFEKISAMTREAKQVSYRTFRKYVSIREVSKMLGYDRYLPLKKDWHVGFFKSHYDGKPCYYLVHSAIEYIWTGT